MEKQFQKLSQTQKLKVNKLIKKFWQTYDSVNNKFIKSDVWMNGLSPRYLFESDNFLIDLSQDNVNQMLGACFEFNGTSNIIGKMFEIKTNGKTGKEIRYYFNLSKDNAKQNPISQQTEEINPEDLPF